MKRDIFSRLLSICNLRMYQKGESIIEDPNRVDTLQIVFNGVVEVQGVLTGDSNSSAVTVRHLDYGNVIAIEAYWNRTTAVPLWLTDLEYMADTPCTIAEVKYHILHKAFDGSLKDCMTQVKDALMQELLLQQQAMYRRVLDLCTSSVMIKARNAIEQMAMTHGRIVGETICWEINNRNQLADMIGSSREIISRYFSTLEQEGVISVRGKAVTLFNPSQEILDHINERTQI